MVPKPDDGLYVEVTVVEVVESGMIEGKVSRLVTVEVVDPVPGSLDSLLKVGLKVLEAEPVIGEP